MKAEVTLTLTCKARVRMLLTGKYTLSRDFLMYLLHQLNQAVDEYEDGE